jgi:hypothetical protein
VAFGSGRLSRQVEGFREDVHSLGVVRAVALPGVYVTRLVGRAGGADTVIRIRTR